MRTRKTLPYHTFIGLIVEVAKSSSRGLIGLRGKVVGETKNLIIIETETGEKKIPKTGCVFRFFLNDGPVEIKGSAIAFRPEERPKKV